MLKSTLEAIKVSQPGKKITETARKLTNYHPEDTQAAVVWNINQACSLSYLLIGQLIIRTLENLAIGFSVEKPAIRASC
ncbi:MAG: hypothetical protein F6J90_30365 [Moorea sp. SIOASIH]|uniref:hypothetical protein n=1 Tax=Moorena sp. SIOASIH TaxID=2607817 RepID=UPI0013BDA3CD|nr:hypothetical protein [Moorena sp. SIOASIH]NEO40414.1 hypothetical protein [Moorena sp. SIOASIH]NEO89399.1 hypothetical protein [Moorena sp. SIO3G5]